MTLLTPLIEKLGVDVVLTSPDRRDAYGHDESTFAPWHRPEGVVLARTVDDVREAVMFAAEHHLSVVPQGARTGLSGGSNTAAGSLAISLERMDAILEIEPVERIAVVQPGVLNATLSRAVSELGLFYPPDPGSWEISTLGGNVATNAGGLCCVKYGVTADYVRGLQVVLADGTVIRTGRRTRKGVVGYDLTHLIAGSEGTLGIITEITLQLVTAPQEPVTVAGTFGSVDAAARAVHAMARSGLSPSLLELMDGVSLRTVDAMFHLGIPPDCDAMLITQHDGDEPARRAFVHDVTTLFELHGATEVAVGETAQETDLLLTARRNAHFAGEALGAMLTDDVCVPLAALSTLVTEATTLGEDAGLTVSFIGHAGDGNIHSSIIYERGDAEQAARAHQLSEKIARLALRLGGTVSGEHGIGTLKKSMLHEELGDDVVQLHRRIKTALDPTGLLNPGTLFS